MATMTIPVGGMHCQHCVGSVKDAVSALPGITGVTVELEKGLVVVQGESPDAAAVKKAIDDIGFEAGDPV